MERTGANEAALKVASVKKEIDAIEKDIAKRHGEGFTMLRVEKHLDNRTTRQTHPCLLYTSPSPRDGLLSRMPSSA